MLVKQSVGKTPHQLILAEKPSRAMRHLAGEDINITIGDISGYLGFSSSKEFRKIFKEAFGFCPSELPNRTKHSPVNVSERR
ncbi:MAG: AraC family transcriptional regulator [Acidobacteria bacterium]|nr:AraC family transcriptional regulator [Acidobacteriota bacterium]